ncbi:MULTISPECIES: hypothetical protein [unclassified Pseudoclavibacter]|uniref:hypothetical protein n=1 Tax=unclassified Pseudoclavibacter TaxID=2615177 RepID=UPI002015F0BA|nr:hypothetical protein [Pseudoclavibacter sp. Marseille-Q4354]
MTHSDDQSEDAATRIGGKPRRRVTTAPPHGSDPAPQSVDGRREPAVLAGEDSPSAWGDADVRYADDRAESPRGPNDDRLRADKPPHYG